MSSGSRMDSTLTGMWVSFFTAAGIPSDVGATYALTFSENRIQNDMLLDLNKEYLRDMGITRMGDVIAILRHAKQVHENAARDRVLSTTTVTSKVPVAAVTGRTTVAQPSSPASRILEHYTRNPTDTSPTNQLKRKSSEMPPDVEAGLKKSRLIRFSSPAQHTVKEAPVKQTSKQTVFARLGGSDAPALKASVKPIYARLGAKPAAERAIPLQKDALKYEGILKASPPQKIVTVTTSKTSRKISMGGTMRADEAPLSAKEKLAKGKSVKFSSHVEYKEIEPIQKKLKPAVNFTSVFNKPERRLSMPDGASVKQRLGNKSGKDFTITKNVFSRLGA